jgi:hypothetical protein
MFHALRRCAIAAVLVLAGGCAAAPVQTMSDTRQAIQAAEAAGAQQSAPGQLAAARDGLKRAEDLIRARDYRAAKREALSARAYAAEALAASSPR